MKKYFQKQFAYNKWANEKLVEHIMHNKIKDEKILNLFSHLVSVEEMWLERLKQTPDYLIDVWETFSIQEIEVLSNNNAKNWHNFIKRQNKNNFNNLLCNYENSDGEKFTNLFIDIMQHVITHSIYHRGQINFLLSTKKVNLTKDKYIFYLRENNL